MIPVDHRVDLERIQLASPEPRHRMLDVADQLAQLHPVIACDPVTSDPPIRLRLHPGDCIHSSRSTGKTDQKPPGRRKECGPSIRVLPAVLGRTNSAKTRRVRPVNLREVGHPSRPEIRPNRQARDSTRERARAVLRRTLRGSHSR